MAASRARTIREPMTMMAMMPPRLMCLPSRHQWPNFLLQEAAASDWDTESSVGLKLPPLAAMAACRRHTDVERRGPQHARVHDDLALHAGSGTAMLALCCTHTRARVWGLLDRFLTLAGWQVVRHECRNKRMRLSTLQKTSAGCHTSCCYNNCHGR